MMVLLMYTALFVPYKTAFIDVDPPGLPEFELLIDILFGTDIFVNFITAVEIKDSNKVESRPC
jgi:hypothetical protein